MVFRHRRQFRNSLSNKIADYITTSNYLFVGFLTLFPVFFKIVTWIGEAILCLFLSRKVNQICAFLVYFMWIERAIPLVDMAVVIVQPCANQQSYPRLLDIFRTLCQMWLDSHAEHGQRSPAIEIIAQKTFAETLQVLYQEHAFLC